MEQKIKGYLDKYPIDGSMGEVAIHNHKQRGASHAQSLSISAASRKQERVGAISDADYESSSLSPLTPVMALISSALHNADADGRIAIDIVLEGNSNEVAASGVVHPKSALRFLHLNPSLPLAPLLKEARTLILAGGTMAPIEGLTAQLFPELALEHPERIRVGTYGHVVPREHIQALIVRSGPAVAGGGQAQPLQFTFKARSDPARRERLFGDLGESVLSLLQVVPLGVVAFFPSYALEAEVVEFWATHGPASSPYDGRATRVYGSAEQAVQAAENALSAAAAGGAGSSSTAPPPPRTWLEHMRARKCIFREPRTSGGVDQVLVHYARVIGEAEGTVAPPSPLPVPLAAANQWKRSNAPPSKRISARDAHASAAGPPSFTDASLRPGQTGALMLAVVGGKLSEGINFSDGLARALLVVGMPYPNKHEASMQEKIKYLEQQEARSRAKAAEVASKAMAAAAEGASVVATSEATKMDVVDEESKEPQQPLTSRVAPPASNGARTGSSHSNSNDVGSRYLESLCMRAVNQSIGRAIRHRNDYAAIVLLDARYTDANIVAALPAWIKQFQQQQQQQQHGGAPAPVGKFNPRGVTLVEARMAVSKFFAWHKQRINKLAAAPAVAATVSSGSANSSNVGDSSRAPAASLAMPLPQKRKAADEQGGDGAQPQRPAKMPGSNASGAPAPRS
jgi:chromosome transmission fidelity protein 1